MIKRLLFFGFAFCLFSSHFTHAQRQLPYPILFVHGFAGNSDNWKPFVDYLSSQPGFYAAPNNRLDYCLNADGDQSIAQVYTSSNHRSDIYDYNNALSISDLYLLNFDTCPNLGGSNRSGAVKQGYAVGLAVSRILSVTGADKVILIGHSMGGLAIREYLQTRSNWATGDGRHHVAKVVTVSTPHGGSNLGLGDINLGSLLGDIGVNDYDELSEAVRDLRTDYKTGYRGVYLFGGYENSTYIRRGFVSSYYNLDVNCNGRAGDLVQGLNQKDIPNDLAYALVIGNSYLGNSDGVVTAFSQNLNNFYSLNAPIFNHPYYHTAAIDKAKFEEIYALDEPSQNDLAYSVGVGPTYKGMLTVQSNGSWRDYDRYRFFASGRGIITASVNIAAEAAGISRLISANGQILSSQAGASTFQTLTPGGGDHFLEVEGTSGNGWRTYYYNLNFCPLPEDPVISTNGKNSICEGELLTLSTSSGYDAYNWYKDGVRLSQTGSQISVTQSGNYTIEGIKCGVTRSAGSVANVVVNPLPSLPTISLSPDGQGLVSNALTGNQWYLNGTVITGATAPVLPYSMLSAGAVSLKVTSAKGCTNNSAAFVITATEPPVTTSVLEVASNPAATYLQVKVSTAPPFSLQLTNLLGQIVWSKQVTANDKEHRLDVTNLHWGLYLLRLSSSTQGQVLKVFIE